MVLFRLLFQFQKLDHQNFHSIVSNNLNCFFLLSFIFKTLEIIQRFSIEGSPDECLRFCWKLEKVIPLGTLDFRKFNLAKHHEWNLKFQFYNRFCFQKKYFIECTFIAIYQKLLLSFQIVSTDPKETFLYPNTRIVWFFRHIFSSLLVLNFNSYQIIHILVNSSNRFLGFINRFQLFHRVANFFSLVLYHLLPYNKHLPLWKNQLSPAFLLETFWIQCQRLLQLLLD